MKLLNLKNAIVSASLVVVVFGIANLIPTFAGSSIEPSGQGGRDVPVEVPGYDDSSDPEDRKPGGNTTPISEMNGTRPSSTAAPTPNPTPVSQSENNQSENPAPINPCQ